MKKAIGHTLLLPLCFFAAVLLAGCSGQKSYVVPQPEDVKMQKSYVVLLPEDGKVSGEVTVTNSRGSQVLNQSWQATEIAGVDAGPDSPVVRDKAEVQSIVGDALSAMPLPPVHYVLHFKLNSAKLVPESELLLPEIVRSINERNPSELSVIGHTDTLGSVKTNYQLGLLRANTVTDLLKSLGAAPVSIETYSHGKSDLLIKTRDETPEPRNRRVEVTIR